MAYNAQIRTVEVKAPGWNPLATLGGPGVLKGIGIAESDQRDHYIKIEHDGTVIAEDLIAGSHTNPSHYENTGLTFDIPFDGQITVYGRDDPAVTGPKQSPLHRYWVTFATGYQPVKIADDD